MTREIFEPAKPAYYTVIPSAHCPKGSETRYVTAPLQAGIDGSPVHVEAQNQPPTEVTKAKETGPTISGYGNIVVKDNLTYEEYQRAIALLGEIENGTHHVINEGATDVLQTNGEFTGSASTFHNEITSVSSPGGDFHPLLVDIEKNLRLAPIDPNGVKQPIPPSKEGFVPLGGGGPAPVKLTDTLPDNDPTRLNDAYAVATNQQAIKSNTGMSEPRDMINKYTTHSASGSPTNGDKAVVSNDVVMFEDPSVGSSGPAAPAQTARDTPTVPREFNQPNLNFK